MYGTLEKTRTFSMTEKLKPRGSLQSSMIVYLRYKQDNNTDQSVKSRNIFSDISCVLRVIEQTTNGRMCFSRLTTSDNYRL